MAGLLTMLPLLPPAGACYLLVAASLLVAGCWLLVAGCCRPHQNGGDDENGTYEEYFLRIMDLDSTALVKAVFELEAAGPGSSDDYSDDAAAEIKYTSCPSNWVGL